ncbi:MAG: hypothetical protein FWC27_00730 [Firmicutes bacterium]|nr:hypothetical protein [Bacillota bacterium]
MRNQMVPSEAAQIELRDKIEAARPVNHRAWGRALALAASLALVIGGTLGAMKLLSRTPPIAPPPPGPMQGSGEITGLPVKRALLSDMPGDGVMADRALIATLQDFFDYELHSFVLARVTNTQATKETQQATIEILEWAYNQPVGAQEPVTLTLTQYLRGGCMLEEQTNLLRRGGVYLLPLARHEGEYYLMGDLDVLFEVDEQGKIYSHSSFEDFAAYDGKPWQDLMEAIQNIVRDNPLLVQYPRFSKVLREGVPLAEITVLDAGTKGDAGGSPYLSQRVRAERVLRQGTGKSYHVKLSEGPFTLNTFGHEPQAQPGERYLVFIYGNEHEYSFEQNRAARINADGTIAPLTEDWNAFSELAGMTVEQVLVLLEKAG